MIAPKCQPEALLQAIIYAADDCEIMRIQLRRRIPKFSDAITYVWHWQIAIPLPACAKGMDQRRGQAVRAGHRASSGRQDGIEAMIPPRWSVVAR